MVTMQHQHVQILMEELEQELRQQRLWSDSVPSVEALSSTMPFMYDTLRFHEWLQWIFIPRTRAVMDAKQSLPSNSQITPLAEHELKKIPDIDSTKLIALIQAIDDAFNNIGF